jgi:hypothetical protein
MTHGGVWKPCSSEFRCPLLTHDGENEVCEHIDSPQWITPTLAISGDTYCLGDVAGEVGPRDCPECAVAALDTRRWGSAVLPNAKRGEQGAEMRAGVPT